jgi:hypothetical protein
MNALIDDAVAELAKGGDAFQRIDSAKWISEIERKLNHRFPLQFRSLVTRYRFSSVDLEKAELFSNLGDYSDFDLTAAPFRDTKMSPWLSSVSRQLRSSVFRHE